jgi:group I intron endonuclease
MAMPPRNDPITPDPKSQSGIYQIRNTINGKLYVGSAKCFRNRWQIHRTALNTRKHHSQKLQRAWLKYGPQAFAWEILEFVANHADLVRIEQGYLDRLRPFDGEVGYNISPTAGSNLGIKKSDEMRAKMSASRKGRKLTEYQRESIRKSLIGRPVSEETRARISESNKGRRNSPEAIAQMAEKLRGRKLTEEHKAKVGAAGRGRKASPETLAKRSVIAKAAYTEETKERLRASRKGKGHTPEAIERIKAALSNPEVRAKIRESRRKTVEKNRRKSGQGLFGFVDQPS